MTGRVDLAAIRAEVNRLAAIDAAASVSVGGLASQRANAAKVHLARHVPALLTELERLRRNGPCPHTDALTALRAEWKADVRALRDARAFARWVTTLDEPGSAERRTITLNEIIRRAGATLGDRAITPNRKGAP